MIRVLNRDVGLFFVRSMHVLYANDTIHPHSCMHIFRYTPNAQVRVTFQIPVRSYTLILHLTCSCFSISRDMSISDPIISIQDLLFHSPGFACPESNDDLVSNFRAVLTDFRHTMPWCLRRGTVRARS